jgi:hypothetical protein
LLLLYIRDELKGAFIMKKVTALIFAILLCTVTLTSCSKKTEDVKPDDTTAVVVADVVVETDDFSIVVPDGWEQMEVDGGFQLYKMSGEVVEVRFLGFNQGETHAQLQVEQQAESYGGTEAKEIELRGKTFWNTRYTLNGVDQIFDVCIEDGVMISVKYAGPGLDTNPEYMEVINSVQFK